MKLDWPPHLPALPSDGAPVRRSPLLDDTALSRIADGRPEAWLDTMGARAVFVDGVPGVRFVVWAPNARHVSVIGDFNGWDAARHPMQARPEAGVWEVFVPRLAAGTRYKYRIIEASGWAGPDRADPVAGQNEGPPGNASVIVDPRPFTWTDENWLRDRARRQAPDAPLSIYEIHPGSWLREGSARGWALLTERLIPYVKRMGFTHIELLPIMEHPFEGSWGYQPLGLFAPDSRLGSPHDFARFVDQCHEAGIGVILDWVPAHFPNDGHGLVRFDGTALYEHQDPREGFHRDWNTLIYNLGRYEVRGFLIGSALHWIEHYHVDGLRVDAVASMLYRDYSRAAGEWIPNQYGGRENLEAIDFLRRLNDAVHLRCPGAVTIAEESTAWPGVTTAVADGGLGFDYKWNMGWMHDTLRYLQQDPIHRRWHHHDMTFGLIYAFAERFVLPLSHDEVVHGKGSLFGKMPGDTWQKLAGLRAYLGFMWTHPGKKLLFMGGELGQPSEWNHDGQVDWSQLDDPAHAGTQRLLADLNHLYVATPALHRGDHLPAGFQWLIGDDADNSVYAYLRLDPAGAHAGESTGSPVLVICNLTPVPRFDYRVGVPRAGTWRERLNTDAAVYGGSNLGNDGAAHASLPNPDGGAIHGQPASLSLTLPPMSTLILQVQET